MKLILPSLVGVLLASCDGPPSELERRYGPQLRVKECAGPPYPVSLRGRIVDAGKLVFQPEPEAVNSLGYLVSYEVGLDGAIYEAIRMHFPGLGTGEDLAPTGCEVRAEVSGWLSKKTCRHVDADGYLFLATFKGS